MGVGDQLTAGGYGRSGGTQEKLAFRSELDRSYLGQVERGEVNISIDNIGKIVRGLRVAPAALFEDGPSR